MADFGLNYDIVTLQGYDALQRRLAAVQGAVGKDPQLMRQLGLQANREQLQMLYRQVTRRTGFAGRTIGLGEVTPVQVRTVARSYAVYIDRGTRAHVIAPRKAGGVLAWPTGAGARRLTGATRKGYAGSMAFARQVKHPGTKPRPFMVPGAERAVKMAGVLDRIVTVWNDAA